MLARVIFKCDLLPTCNAFWWVCGILKTSVQLCDVILEPALCAEVACGLLFCLCAISNQMLFSEKYISHEDSELASLCCVCLPWLLLDHGNVHTALKWMRCWPLGSVHSPHPAKTITVWIIMLRLGGGGRVKWSLEEHWPSTLFPQACGQGTIEGTHTYASVRAHTNSFLMHTFIPTIWFWNKHLAP